MGRNSQRRRRATAGDRPGGRPPGSGAAARAHEAEVERARSSLQTWVRLREAGHAAEAAAVRREVGAALARGPVRAAVVAGLVSRLAEAITWAWEHHWEPADVLRQVSRRLGEREAAVARDAVAASLSRYASASVSPRWADQLAAHDVRVRWAPSTDHLTAALPTDPVAAADVLADASSLLDLLVRLPPLEPVEALPGRWRASAEHPPGEAPPVTERVLTRVRALLAQAESTPYPAEAETFSAAAQSLMARHSIDQALLARSGPAGRREAPVARRVGVDRPYEAPRAGLLEAVAVANRCRTVWSRDLGFSTVVGFESDVAATQALYLSLLVQATHAMTGHGSRSARGGGSRTRSFRQSFLLAYAHRIGERLRAVTDAEVDSALAEGRGSAPGRDTGAGTGRGSGSGADLVVVLADRGAEVDEAVTSLFPALTHGRLGRARDEEGWAAGTWAAERASLAGGTAVEGR